MFLPRFGRWLGDPQDGGIQRVRGLQRSAPSKALPLEGAGKFQGPFEGVVEIAGLVNIEFAIENGDL